MNACNSRSRTIESEPTRADRGRVGAAHGPSRYREAQERNHSPRCRRRTLSSYCRLSANLLSDWASLGGSGRPFHHGKRRNLWRGNSGDCRCRPLNSATLQSQSGPAGGRRRSARCVLIHAQVMVETGSTGLGGCATEFGACGLEEMKPQSIGDSEQKRDGNWECQIICAWSYYLQRS